MINITNVHIIGYLAGAALMVAGIICLLIMFRKKDRCTQKAIARVVRFDVEEVTSTDADGDTTNFTSYTPVFQFRLPSGRLVEIAGRIGQADSPYELGQTVEIYYNPQNPEEVDIQRDSRLFVIGGFVAFGVGVVVFLMAHFRVF